MLAGFLMEEPICLGIIYAVWSCRDHVHPLHWGVMANIQTFSAAFYEERTNMCLASLDDDTAIFI